MNEYITDTSGCFVVYSNKKNKFMEYIEYEILFDENTQSRNVPCFELS